MSFNGTKHGVTKSLTAEQKKKYLALLLEGVAHANILYTIQAKQAEYKQARKDDKEFAAEIAWIKKNRPKQIEAQLYRYATGKCKIVKLTYQAELDDEGNPVKVKGRQQFVCVRKEVTHLPPNPNLIQFFLKQKQEKGQEGTFLVPDTLIEELEKAAAKACEEPKG